MTYSIIAAVGKERQIGLNGKTPWQIPEDLKHFKEITSGKTVIMGRKTFESIGHPLPNRTNIILTQDNGFSTPKECLIAYSIEDALFKAGEKTETFVIGGAKIYDAALPRAQKLYLTEVDYHGEADTFFPIVDSSKWKIISKEIHSNSINSPYSFEFVVYKRNEN